MRQDLTILKWVIVTSMMFGISFSFQLWINMRDFPLIPIISDFPLLVFPYDIIYLSAIYLTLSLIMIINRPWLIWVFVGLMVYPMLSDQIRWQPWVYQYLLMLTALAIGIRQKYTVRYGLQAVNTLRIIIVCVYFFSGLFKLNTIFIENALPSLLPWLFTSLSPAAQEFVGYGSIAIPFIEMFAGLGLLFQRTRKIAVLVAFAMHLFIIVFVIILLGWNLVILPWNVAMMILVSVLFVRMEQSEAEDIVVNRKNAYHIAVVILVGILPFGHLFNKWDAYPSFGMYSFKQPNMLVEFTERNVSFGYYRYDSYIFRTEEAAYIDVGRWAMESLNVPVYPEERVFRAIADDLCRFRIMQDARIYIGPAYHEKTLGSRTTCNDMLRDRKFADIPYIFLHQTSPDNPGIAPGQETVQVSLPVLQH